MAACGGAPSPTADYLDRVSAITTRMTTDSVATLQQSASPTHLQVAAIVGLRRTALAEIDLLEPPAEVRPEHLALVQALSSLVEAGDAFLAATGDLDQAAFQSALDASTDIDALAAEVHAACVVIEQRSQALDHPVAMGC